MAYFDYNAEDRYITQRQIDDYENWKDSRLPDHVHHCANCDQWIKDCRNWRCADRDKPILCGECQKKAA